MSKVIIYALIFSLYLSIAYAASFDIEVVPITNRIAIDEFARFQINIKNNLENNEEYRIYSGDFPIWDIRTEPLVNPITLELEANAEGSVELVVDPLKIRDIGTYAVNLNIRSKFSNELVLVPLKVSVLSVEPLIQGYVPTVVTSVGVPEKIDPREEIPIEIVLNNQNIVDYPELIITLDGKLIKDTATTQLGPKEEKRLELTASIDPFTSPQTDNLVVAVFRGERSIVNPIVRKIEVIEYTQQDLVSVDKGFLKTESTYEFLSNSPDYTGTFRVETGMLSSIFSSTSPKARIEKIGGKRYFVWDINLQNNRMQAVVSVNFIPLVIVILLLIVVIIMYFTLRTPLVMKKSATHLIKTEGGISAMTVVVHIRNRGQKKITGIDITESVPSLVSVEREVSIGSLQPAKILTHEKKGTIVKWVIDSLDASDERVLSYKIKSKLSILGGFDLPAAGAVFKSDDKSFTSASNRLHVSG